MNLHLPQSLDAQAELAALMAVQENMISTQTGRPMMSLHQDSLLAVYLMTQPRQTFNFDTMVQFCYDLPGFETLLVKAKDKKRCFGGTEIFSILFPKDFQYAKAGCVITDGQIVHCPNGISKEQIGPKNEGIMHVLHRYHGAGACVRFLDDAQTMLRRFMEFEGFTVGIKDCMLSSPAPLLGNVDFGTDEMSARIELQQEMMAIGDAVQKDPKAIGNRFTAMMKAGSKGSTTNLTQICGIVGQQLVNGQRIHNDFPHRTLAHFQKYDNTATARGYVQGNYINGLNPIEFFFHAAGGREGLTDTAIKTSDTGYLYRKLEKSTESICVRYDNSVRNCNEDVVQIIYGEDSIDPVSVVKSDLPITAKFPDLDKYSNDASEIAHWSNLLEKLWDNPPAQERTTTEWLTAVDIIGLCKRASSKKREGTEFVERTICFTQIEQRINQLCKRVTRRNTNAQTMRFEPSLIFQIHLAFHLRLQITSNFSETQLDQLFDVIESKYMQSLICPGEPVGGLCASACSAPATQMTLNSVAYETEVLIDDNGALRRVLIGEYIDHKIDVELDKSTIQSPQPDIMYAPNPIQNTIQILACDTKGKVTWRKIEAFTRHPVVNEDGTTDVLRVTTNSGRTVVATLGDSFLHRKDNEIVPICGRDLAVGMYLPISKILPIGERMKSLRFSDYLPKSDFLYMSEVHKALHHRETDGHLWWSINGGVNKRRNKGVIKCGTRNFELPYRRGDAFVEAFIGYPPKEAKRARFCRADCVYPLNAAVAAPHIPEQIELNNDFGFFVGAYLASGCCTSHHLMISNINDEFNAKIDSFVASIDVRYHIDDQINYYNRYSRTLRMHSLVLTTLFTKMFGVKENKRIPAELLGAPTRFLHGLIDGYMSAKAYLQVELKYLSCKSTTNGLFEDIRQVLARFSISSSVVVQDEIYHFMIHPCQMPKFQQIFSLTITRKDDQLQSIREGIKFSKIDIIPTMVLKNKVWIKVPRSHLLKIMETANDVEDIATLEQTMNEEIMYDEIVDIQRIPNTSPWVYDFTVQGPRNFNLYSGLAMRDSTGSKVTSGLKRLAELYNDSSPHHTSLKIFLKDPTISKREIRDLAYRIKAVTLNEAILIVRILHTNLTMEELQSRYPFLKVWNTVYGRTPQGIQFNVCPSGRSELKNQDKPFLASFYVEMELDRKLLLRLHVTLADIRKIILEHFPSLVILASPQYDEKLILLIFMPNDPNEDHIRPKKKETARRQATKKGGHMWPTPSTSASAEVIPHSIMESWDFWSKHHESLWETVLLSGEPNIKETSVEKMPFRDEFYIQAVGTNITGLCNYEEINEYKTLLDQVQITSDLLGIEAARSVLYTEISEVLANAGVVDPRHILLLVDTMTYHGDVSGTTRHSMAKSDLGFIEKSCFESGDKFLLHAAVTNQLDDLKGVSAQVAFGLKARVGTGAFEVLLDTNSIIGNVVEHDTYELSDDDGPSYRPMSPEFDYDSSTTEEEEEFVPSY